MQTTAIFNCSAFPGGAVGKITDHIESLFQKDKKELYLKVSLSEDILPALSSDRKIIMHKTDKIITLFNDTFDFADKIIFVVPEYNASYPGVLKLFLDIIDHTQWEGKKACIIGVSAGRGGNLRGMEHLTTVLNYLKINVYHDKLPLSNTKELIDTNGALIPEVQKTINELIFSFLKF